MAYILFLKSALLTEFPIQINAREDNTNIIFTSFLSLSFLYYLSSGLNSVAIKDNNA